MNTKNNKLKAAKNSNSIEGIANHNSKKLMIGGTALVKLGSSRQTQDLDYLVLNKESKDAFLHDKANNIDYCNANGNKFFAAVMKMEEKNNGEIASPQALLELKAYAFVQHCQNGFWDKVDDCEYDIKFLCRKYNLKALKIVTKFISEGELSEVMKIIDSIKK